MAKKIIIVLIVVVLLIGYVINSYLNQGLPTHQGQVTLKGLSANVSILRDSYGVPHIFAESEADAYFALGYAMAQDRLFQMEFLRAAGNGSLSEILGEDLLRTDKFLRRIMLRPRNAEALFATFSPEVQTMMKSTLAGINAFLKQELPLPLEFRLLGHTPELWTIADVMAITKLQSWNLSYNYDIELIYRQLNEKLGAQATAGLFPYYTPEHLKIMDTFNGDTEGDEELLTQAQNLRELLGTNGGSNNWVVAGSRTKSGKPILASDPHLHGSRLPGPWYFAHLNAPCLDVAGGFFPGLPTALIGHNRDIAWALTNMGPDVQDLFIEEINPDNPNQYLYKDEWRDFEIIPTDIRIKDDGEDSGYRIETFQVRKSIHGPVVKEEDEVLALAWTGHLFNKEVEAFYRLNQASNWETFTEAVSYFSTAPQNFIYADVNGNIGYYGAGKVPIRKQGSGLFPVPGWTGEFDWIGWIPFEDMPHIYNPTGGMIVTANAEPYGKDYPYPMPGIYAPDYRTRRIKELLEAKSELTLEDMATIQFDRKSLLAPVFLNALTAVIPDDYADQRQALQDWDAVLSTDSPEGALYHETLHHFLRLIWIDEMGEELAEDYLDTWYISLNRWVAMLEDNENPWFDKVGTDLVETRDDLLLEAFEIANKNLSAQFGSPDFSDWDWGTIHPIEFHHVFEAKGGLIKKFFNYGPFPFGGDGETVNRATHVFQKPYKAEMTASMRMLVDMANTAQSRMANASGQVGVPLHEHYTDLVDAWLEGDYLTMHLDRDALGDKTQELILIPE